MFRLMQIIVISFSLLCFASSSFASFSHDYLVSFENLHYVKNRELYSHNDELNFEVEAHFVYDNEINFNVDLKPRFKIDALNSSRFSYQPHKVFIKNYGQSYELGVGFLRLGFGASIFYNPTDVLSRYDFKDSVYDPERLSEFMLVAKKYFKGTEFFADLKVSGFILPWLIQTPLPESDTRFALKGSFNGIPFELDNTQSMPDSYLESVGFGMNLSGMSKRLEWSFLFYHGPERMPGYFLTPNSSGALRLRPFYFTTDVFGLNVSLPVKSFLFRAELAYKLTVFNDAVTHNIQNQTDDLVPENYFQYVPGVDYVIPAFLGDNELKLTVEYYGENNTSLALGEYRPFKNDLLFGFRLDLNDSRMTYVECGMIKDLSNTELMVLLDFQTKIYKELKWQVKALVVNKDSDQTAPLSFFENNSYISSKLMYSF